MNRKPFTISHRVKNAILWYGTNYTFLRQDKNEYNEPVGDAEGVETIRGIYHANREGFVSLLNTEGAIVKNKLNKGILTFNSDLKVKQGDTVCIESIVHTVTAIEPVLYGDVQIATEISIEEVLNEFEI